MKTKEANYINELGISTDKEGKPMYQILGMKNEAEYKKFKREQAKKLKKFQKLNLKPGDLIGHYYTNKDQRKLYISKVIPRPERFSDVNDGEGVYTETEYELKNGKKISEGLNKGPFWEWYWTFSRNKYVPLGEYGTGANFIYKRTHKVNQKAPKKQKRLVMV